ncbi:hypothetical protein AHF37_09353 [Paragonimus kellicotti]|nr:hypothetical protein AHF37_09353 [Paragonimus kellicotti]
MFVRTADAFATKFLSSRIDNEVERVKLNDLDTAPNSLDRRQKGALGPVNYQGACDKCSALSVAGSVWVHWVLKTVLPIRAMLVELNHAVLTIEYGYEDGLAYWIINNILREVTGRRFAEFI